MAMFHQLYVFGFVIISLLIINPKQQKKMQRVTESFASVKFKYIINKFYLNEYSAVADEQIAIYLQDLFMPNDKFCS